MKIVSGKTGSPHVTSHEFRQIIEGILGQGSYIFESGDNLEPELVSNNLLKIKGGMMSHHGNVSVVENYDEVELSNGTQGMKRIDLIVNRYTRNDETKIESNAWVCIMGTPDASSPTAPDYIAGNLQGDNLVDDCPFLEVYYDGINVTEVKKLLHVTRNVSELDTECAELNKKYTVEEYTTPSSSTWTIVGSLPNGFNPENSVIIGFTVNSTSGSWFSNPQSIQAIMRPDGLQMYTTVEEYQSRPIKIMFRKL